MTTVCSGFHPAGYQQYGERFLRTFARHWAPEIDLVVYTEEPVEMPRGECRMLWECAGAREFNDRHSGDLRRSGRASIEGWRPKDRRTGYGWRFDALRWYKQCIIPHDAAQHLPDGQVLTWLDADVVTFAPVEADLIPSMLVGADLMYMGRGGYHSEIGFWAVRLNAATRSFLRAIASIYTSDMFLALPEHHSAYVFDDCRKTAELNGLRSKNLTHGVGAGHVWHRQVLGEVTDHLKGSRRKELGYSPEHPSKWWERQ